MRYIIVSNGDISNYGFYKSIIDSADYIICADGGAKHLIKMNIIPNVIIGDLDSIHEDDKVIFFDNNVKFHKFPANKDATDTELAVDYAISHNPKEIILIGVIGSRMDHSIANITLLKKILGHGIRGRIINENNEICILNDEYNEIVLTREKHYYLSLVPLCNRVEGITLEGFKYPLINAKINLGSSLGVSNEFDRDEAKVKIQSGVLLVIKARD